MNEQELQTPAQEFCDYDLTTIPRSAPVSEALTALSEDPKGVIAVTDVDGNFEHLLTAAALLRIVASGKPLSTLLKDIDIEPSPTIAATASLEECIDCLAASSHCLVAVVNSNQFIGILSPQIVLNRFLYALKDSKAQLQTMRSALSRRDDYLGIVAHDLRSPLAVISSCADLVLEDYQEATIPRDLLMIDLIQRVKANSQSALRLLSDLLDVGRLKAGGKLTRRLINVQLFLENFVKNLSLVAQERGVSLLIRHVTPSTLFADPERIGQALDNLVNNAIKFSPTGGRVFLDAAYLPPKGDRAVGEIQLSVEDEGSGIPQQQMAMIFEKYKQLDNAEGASGVGLGLSIARQFVALHQGRIEVESSEGRGAIFRIILPGGRLQYEGDSLMSSKDGAKKHTEILIVEDDEDSREILQAILEDAGYVVHVACDGLDGLMQFDMTGPDLVLLDVRMREMDGFEVLQRINARVQGVPIILMSGLHPSLNNERVMNSFQAVSFLEKPFETAVLLDAIKNALAGKADALAAGPTGDTRES